MLTARIARAVWIVCLSIGTVVHLSTLITSGGRFPGYPLASVVFWNSLTVLDPLAAALLIWRPRLGVALTLALMLADVAHNIWAVANMDAFAGPVLAQIAFLSFVVGTTPMIWRLREETDTQVR